MLYLVRKRLFNEGVRSVAFEVKVTGKSRPRQPSTINADWYYDLFRKRGSLEDLYKVLLFFGKLWQYLHYSESKSKKAAVYISSLSG